MLRFAAALVLAIVGMAGDAVAANGGREIWKVASEHDFPPYNFTSKGQRTGIDTLIAEAVLAEMGVTPLHIAVSLPEVKQLLDQNAVHMGFQLIGTEKARRRFILVGPFREGRTELMVKKGAAIRFDSLDDLVGLRLGVVRGFAYSEAFGADKRLTKVRAYASLTNFRRLFLGVVDAVVGDRLTLLYYADLDGVRPDKFEFLPKPLAIEPRYFAFPLKRAAEAARFQAALDRLKADGTIDRIIASWLDQAPEIAE